MSDLVPLVLVREGKCCASLELMQTGALFVLLVNHAMTSIVTISRGQLGLLAQNHVELVSEKELGVNKLFDRSFLNAVGFNKKSRGKF